MSLTSNSRPIGVGIIGYGSAGVMHAALVSAEPRMELVSVATKNPERLSLLAQRHPVAGVQTVDEMLSDNDVEVVVIATPNDTHFDLASKVINAGRHVVVDKPFTVAVDEAKQLKSLAARRDVLVTVFHNRRWDNDFLTVRQAMHGKDLGKVHTFISRYERYVPEPSDGWRELAEQGAGCLYDLGSHIIDQALTVFGPPNEVSANLRSLRGSPDDDDNVVFLHYDNVVAELYASFVVRRGGPRFEIRGTKATLVKYGRDTQAIDLANGLAPGSEGWGEDDPDNFATIYGDEEKKVPTLAGTHDVFYRGLAASVLFGAPLLVSADEGIDVMRVIEAAQRSNAEGRRIGL